MATMDIQSGPTVRKGEPTRLVYRVEYSNGEVFYLKNEQFFQLYMPIVEKAMREGLQVKFVKL